MDALTIAFLGLLILLGGVIAWAADRLGRKLGKKRLSLFGLRPRHTAEVLTVGAGILIPFITILVLYAASSDVREWINRGRQAIADLQKTQRELENAQKERDLRQRENNELLSQRNELQRQNRQANDTLAKTRATVADLTKRRSELEGRVGRLSAELRNLGSQIKQIGNRLKEATAELKATSAKLSATQKQVAERQRQLDRLNANFEELNRQFTEVNEHNLRLIEETQRLEGERDTLRRASSDLAQTNLRLEQDIQDRQRFLREMEALLSDAESQVENLRTQKNVLLAQMQDIGEALRNTRFEPMTYQFQQEIARLPVEANLTRDEARNALSTMLRMVRVLATDRGAVERGALPAAGLFGRTDQQQRPIPPSEIENQIVDRIAGKRDPQVLITYAFINAFKGEPVPVDVVVMPNPVVYQANEVLAEAQINGARDMDEILSEVNSLLGGKVLERVKKDQLVARRGWDQPYGPLSTGQVLDIAMQIRNIGRVVRVQALARDDIRAADPLRLTLRVR